MKNAARVFIWIGLISGAWLIVPLIIGIFSLRAINNATRKEDLTGWAIAALVCCSTLGGIFMLNIKEEDLAEEVVVKPTEKQEFSNDCVSQLKGLKELLDEGIITEEEFNRKKEELLFGTKTVYKSKPTAPKTQVVKQQKTTPIKIDTAKLNFTTNLISLICFSLIVLFLCCSKVEYWQFNYYNTTYHQVSPFVAPDVRSAFAYTLLVFAVALMILCIFNFSFKNKAVTIVKHAVLITTLALSMLTFIFNLTYASTYCHACTILGLITTCALIVMEIVYILRILVLYLQARRR